MAAPPWHAPLGRCLGSGGFASVWEIIEGGVLKIAHAAHDLARARMQREAEALGAIGGPAVPRLHGAGVLPDGRAWIAMEHVHGAVVSDLTAAGPLALDVALAIARGTAEALGAVHAAGFAHRDLKPHNLVRAPDGRIVVLDLGLARKLPEDPDDPTRAGVQVGSLEYIAPEQLVDAASVDARADIYAFGCLLYELCAGRPPFTGDAATLERAHAALRPPPLSSLVRVPVPLEQLCFDCLAKQPARRPPSTAALLERLAQIEDASAPARTGHSMSVIREGTQPVVLVWAELPRVDRTLLNALTARKIAIVSQRGRKVLGGVLGADHADPAAVAIAAARDLALAGARVALHLDALAVAPRGGALVPSGPAVDRPEQWLPTVPWTGVVLTGALATVTQQPTRAAPALGASMFTLAEAGESTQLFGRESQLAALEAELGAALAGAGPALVTVTGEHGDGKTLFAATLAAAWRARGITVHLAAIAPPGSGKPLHAALAPLVGDVQGPVVRAIGDALRATARRGPLAILLDDLHLAEHELLDALEYATLGGEALPLIVVGFATSRLESRRPAFGARASTRHAHVLTPLDEESAVTMTAALLKPAEYPPLRALRQIASLARGNPLHLATLAREIHARGAIRTRPNGEHFLDTTALDELPPIALGPWLAARELASLSPELAALARIAAVLGDEVAPGELAAIVQMVERAGGATTPIDTEVGLAELVAHGILEARGEGLAFRQALLQEGIHATTDPDERRAIHAAALAYLEAQPMAAHRDARIALHAEAVGAREIAAAAFAALGQRAYDQHRTLDADQAWQGALRNLDGADVRRARALLGRARARYKLQRIRDALADLADALAIARDAGDAALEIEILLEQATALDWSDDYAASAAAAAQAAARIAEAPQPALALDVELATARSLWRARELATAAAQLDAITRDARASGRPETQILALLMLATLHVDTGALDDALARFGELIPLCEARQDHVHLGAAYANRGWLWSARGDIARCADDLRHVIQIARETGQAALERAATYNLAESLLRADQLDEALRLAERSCAIQRGYGEGQVHWDQLLIARILARLGDARLAPLLGELAAAELEAGDRVVVEILRCAAERASPARWNDALAGAGELAPDLRAELEELRVRTAPI